MGGMGLGRKPKTSKCSMSPGRGAHTVTLKQQRSIWEGDQEIMKSLVEMNQFGL
jgi:hypothetical protein